MRLSFEHNTDAATPRVAPDSSTPDLGVLTRDPAAALQSFFTTVDRVIADNPVAAPRLMELGRKSGARYVVCRADASLPFVKLYANAEYAVYELPS